MADGEVLLSTANSLIATCVIAWVFFFISWVLERPFVWNSVRDYLSEIESIPARDLDSIVAGIHIRTVGGMHNTLQVTLSLYALRDAVLWQDTWHGVTPLSQWILIISAGFFLWDIAVAIRSASTDGPEFIIHGVLCFAFYLYTTVSKNFHFYGCGFLLWEMSTPFVHLRWFLYKIGLKNSKFYLYNGLAMIVAFGLCRICWGGYLGVRFLLAARHPQDVISSGTIWCLRFIWITLNFLNWYWFKLMVGGALRLMFKKPLDASKPQPSGSSRESLETRKAK